MLPFLNAESENSKKYTIAFRGLNYGEGWQDGELSDCKNLGSHMFPSMAQSFGRSLRGEYTDARTLFVKDGLFVVAGGKLYYNDAEVGAVSHGARMAAVGNYVVIFPDKKAYNVETGEFSDMGVHLTVSNATFTDSAISVQAGGLSAFKAGDGVTIEGCAEHPENNKTAIVRSVTDNTLTFYENTFTAGQQAGYITISRDIPDLEHICESNYRLWGTMGNTIYGSKYGDPFNFQVFDGLSGDSYTIDVATEGDFTGCIAFGNTVCFFKENTLHKLYGTKPSNFQLVTTQVNGVKEDSERSMCVINETLYYLGVHGVYAYTGSVPELISPNFGGRMYRYGCAASDGERYYISMCRPYDMTWGLYVYDIRRNIWLKEDDTQYVDIAFCDGCIYLLSEDGKLERVDPTGIQSEIEWSATFCPFHETVNERKGYSKFHMRLELGVNAWVAVEIRRDTDTKWEEVYQTHADYTLEGALSGLKDRRTVSLPILPARCDSVEIRLRGKGECILRTFIREFFVGSDV